jgi:hypothetical protein
MVVPMIERHKQMFPFMHDRISADPWQRAPSPRAQPRTTESREAYPGTDRYAPCPCNSGQKYKFCCGMKRRWFSAARPEHRSIRRDRAPTAAAPGAWWRRR